MRIAAKQREQAVVQTLVENGWSVIYDYQLAADGKFDPTLQPRGPDWLRRFLGDEFFGDPARLFAEIPVDSQLAEVKDSLRQLHTVKYVEICGGSELTDKGLAILVDLTELESLEFIAGSEITDASIPKLKRLTKLKWLSLGSRHISEHSLRELKMVLPSCKIADLDDDEPSQ